MTDRELLIFLLVTAWTICLYQLLRMGIQDFIAYLEKKSK